MDIGWATIILVALAWWLYTRLRPLSPEAKAEIAARQEAVDAAKVYLADPPRLSTVAGRSAGGELLCPVCGGTQFRARRSRNDRWTVALGGGLGLLTTWRNRAQCVTCSAIYRRG
jgi:hypothetical protein